jgi:hypothetical protein
MWNKWQAMSRIATMVSDAKAENSARACGMKATANSGGAQANMAGEARARVVLSDDDRAAIRGMMKKGFLTYEEACELIRIKNKYRKMNLAYDVALPKGIWDSEETAKNVILATLDGIEDDELGSFKDARQSLEQAKQLSDKAAISSSVKRMADLYRKHVIGYQFSKPMKSNIGAQQAFFYEHGILKSLMSNRRPFLDKMGSAAALLRFALPELIDTTIEGALDPLEVEYSYWDNPDNAKKHILSALYTIDGFEDAHKLCDIAKMARLYKKEAGGYSPLDKEKYTRGGQRTFFVERGGLITLIQHKRDFLAGHNSPLSLTCFAIPELIPYLVRDPQRRAEFTEAYAPASRAAADGETKRARQVEAVQALEKVGMSRYAIVVGEVDIRLVAGLQWLGYIIERAETIDEAEKRRKEGLPADSIVVIIRGNLLQISGSSLSTQFEPIVIDDDFMAMLESA